MTFRICSFLLTILSIPILPAQAEDSANYDWLLPNEKLITPFKDRVPIQFYSRGTNRADWEKLPTFWNEVAEATVDPATGQSVQRKVVKIKLPLGINLAPTVPGENPMTLARWKLGKELYFDKALSSNGAVACATCHAPEKGFADASTTSTGIFDKKGGMNAPTVFNSAFNRSQFWDGRATSLEDQAQGPVGNPVEMFDGKGDAWHEAIKRLRAKNIYNKRFEAEFGHLPTRDSVAKAIATYERTVLIGNSLVDRAELAMRKRNADEETTDLTVKAADYAVVLKLAFSNRDKNAVEALGLDLTKDADKVAKVSASIANGHKLFFGKARCNSCHVGESLTDLTFHNLGVGATDGKLPSGYEGRYGAQATGHKNPQDFGAFKTPPLRGLLSTAPYMHDGSEKTLEQVVDYYDHGGNANEFQDSKMRDVDAEAAFIKAKADGKPWTGPEVKVFTHHGKPIIPFKLNLTAEEKKDLVLFLRANQGDPLDSMVADPKK